MRSVTEENYLKAIYSLSGKDVQISTSSIALQLHTTPAAVTDMLKRLSEKSLINYERYRGVSMTANGEKAALNIIRKHRLWEVFLTQVLKFGWEEVHEMAEELEHASSDQLINRLEEFLGHPSADPHGDPIPDAAGKMISVQSVPLSECQSSKKLMLKGVTDHRPVFLQFLTANGLIPGAYLKITSKRDFDHSIEIQIIKGGRLFISHEAAKHLMVEVL